MKKKENCLLYKMDEDLIGTELKLKNIEIDSYEYKDEDSSDYDDN